MLELLVYIFFAVAIVVGIIVTIAVWAVVVGWVIAGILVFGVVLWVVMRVLYVCDRVIESYRDWKRRRENRKRFPGTIAS
jgi:fructose-1,6-bisphosphatase/inositol monophosphatase family enzyme